jgi:hypothetical protein
MKSIERENESSVFYGLAIGASIKIKARYPGSGKIVLLFYKIIALENKNSAFDLHLMNVG